MRVTRRTSADRWRCVSAWSLIACVTWSTEAAPAQAQASAQPVLVVIQAGIGAAEGQALRAELAKRFELTVTTVRSLELAQNSPQAMLVIAVDERGALNAIYWDRAGGFDTLSAPTPTGREGTRAAAIALACALVQRHLDALRAREPARAGSSDAQVDQLAVAHALYGALRRSASVGRLSIVLNLEDF
jgi:hypothetical protein